MFVLFLPLEPIVPSGRRRRTDRTWRDYYSPELKEWVRRKERFLFELFPQYDG